MKLLNSILKTVNVTCKAPSHLNKWLKKKLKEEWK